MAYCPAALTDEDAEFLAQLEHARLVEFRGLYEQPGDEPVAESRAQKRAKERAKERASAVPAAARQAAERPTYVDFMQRLVVDWDLTWGTDPDGRPLPWPVCADSFRQMEHGLRLDIVTSIMMDYLSRPNLGSLSKRFSAATTASGPTTATSSAEPSNTEAASSLGITSDILNGHAVLSGVTG